MVFPLGATGLSEDGRRFQPVYFWRTAHAAPGHHCVRGLRLSTARCTGVAETQRTSPGAASQRDTGKTGFAYPCAALAWLAAGKSGPALGANCVDVQALPSHADRCGTAKRGRRGECRCLSGRWQNALECAELLVRAE